MITQRVLQAIIAPHISEKASVVAESNNQHVFKVRLDADKPTIKRAVEELFGVQVATVRVATQKGKRKRHGRFEGVRSDWKKAYVSLKPGSEIKLSEVE